jgi:hypothetical protein
MDSDPELLQEHPLAEVPEYDVVTFDLNESRWRNHLPPAWEAEWSKKLPLAYIARTYAGLTTGSERTVLRSPTNEREGAPRPDLNLIFDQISYHPGSQSLFCFTGGLTASYDVVEKVNDVIGVAGFIDPGTRVDLVVTIRKKDDTSSRTAVSNVQVLSAGTRSEQEKATVTPAQTTAKAASAAGPPTVVTLLVTFVANDAVEAYEHGFRLQQLRHVFVGGDEQ